MNRIPSKTEHITPVNGNVFLDLGFEPEEAARLLAKSKKVIAEKLALKKQSMSENTSAMMKVSENGN